MSYIEDLFALHESVKHGRFRYPYLIDEVRPLSNRPSLFSKSNDKNSIGKPSSVNDLLPCGALEEQYGFTEAEKIGWMLPATSLQATPSSELEQAALNKNSYQARSETGFSSAMDRRTRRFFEKVKTSRTEPTECKDSNQAAISHSISVIFVHFPTEFSLRLFEHYVSTVRSISLFSQRSSSSCQRPNAADKLLTDRFNDKRTTGFDYISTAAESEKSKLIRFSHLKSTPDAVFSPTTPETFIVLFLDDERAQEASGECHPMSWEEMHEMAKSRLRLLSGKKGRLENPTVYRVLFAPSRESRDVFITAQLQSLGVDLSAPVSDERTQVNEALSLLIQRDQANKDALRYLDDQLISFVVFEIAAAHKRIDSLEKMVELLSEFDASGWNLLSRALAWLDDVKPRIVSRRNIHATFKTGGNQPFYVEDSYGMEIADEICAHLDSDTSLCASLFFEKKETGMDGARAIALRESSLLVYAIARWIVRESPYKYLKDKTTCLDVFGKLLSSAGFSKGFVRLLVVCSGDCLRAASNRQSVARLNLEYLYDIVRESTSPSLDVSDIIALTLRADCDVSGLQEGSCWQNYFLENAPSESQAMVVSSDSHFGQAKLGNMKALSAFADDALDRARKRVDHVPEGELEAALDELDRAVWLQMLVKESLDLSGETDDTTFLAMLTCAVWVDSENVRASFRCGKRELLSPNVVNRLIRTLSRHSIKTDAYHFASLALWYYSGLQGGRFISRNDLREIVLSACDILVKSRSQTEKASAMRVLSTVPLDVFSQFVPSKDALERPTIDVLRHHLETDSSCLLCCLLVLSRIGSRPCGTARFVEMVLQNLSAEGHFNNMIVDSLMFEMQLQAKYDATLSSYLEGSLELSGHNDVAYIIDHGFAVGHYSLELDSEKILIDLIDKKPSLFPIVNLFLHYLQNEGDTDKAFAFYRRTIEAINPTNGDLNSASAWWGKMAGIEQPEGLLVSLLLEASGWKIRRCHIGDRRTRGERISVNAFRKFVKTELKKNKGHSFEKASIEEAIQRYYGDAVLDGIRALALRT